MAAPRYQLCFDADCPLCVWYTGYFEKNGYLLPGEAVALQQCSPESLAKLDPQRMTNQIPLIDFMHNRVLYGPEALITLIRGKHPMLGKWAAWPIWQPIIRLLYNFISYNRKVLAGILPSCTRFTCQPVFNPAYRLAFIIIGHLLAFWMAYGTQLSGIAQPKMTAWTAGFSLIAAWLWAMKSSSRFQLWERMGQATIFLMLLWSGFLIAAIVAGWSGQTWAGAAILAIWMIRIGVPQWKQRQQYLRSIALK